MEVAGCAAVADSTKEESSWKRGEVAVLSPEGSHKRSASVYKAGSVLGGARKH